MAQQHVQCALGEVNGTVNTGHDVLRKVGIGEGTLDAEMRRELKRHGLIFCGGQKSEKPAPLLLQRSWTNFIGTLIGWGS